MSLSNKPHIAIGYGCNLARVHYDDKLFVVIKMTRESYYPFATGQMAHMSDYLIELFETHSGVIDFKLNYPHNFPKKKKAKIRQLLKTDGCDRNILNKWLSLLIN
jgi:hypothetical protein